MTLTEEMLAAARGCVALLIGQRDAPRYFNFSYAGLAGSAIAVLVAVAIKAYLPVLAGGNSPAIAPAWQNFSIVTFLLVLQLAITWWYLRQIGRLDGFIPYVVASNWTALFFTFISIAIALLGVGDVAALLLVGIALLVLEINIARLIVTLTGWQIVIFMVVQAVGGFVGLMLIGLLIQSPDAATGLNS